MSGSDSMSPNGLRYYSLIVLAVLIYAVMGIGGYKSHLRFPTHVVTDAVDVDGELGEVCLSPGKDIFVYYPSPNKYPLFEEKGSRPFQNLAWLGAWGRVNAPRCSIYTRLSAYNYVTTTRLRFLTNKDVSVGFTR